MKPAPRLTAPGTTQAGTSPIPKPSAALLSNLILARASLPDGATKAELTRDLRPLILSDTPAAQWRELADDLVASLVAASLLTQTRTRFASTPTATPQIIAVLGSEQPPKATWSDIRDGALTARALNLDPADRAVLKALASPDGFRALIVQQAFGVGDGRPMSLSKLRNGLALRALERAFGNQIKRGIGSASGLATKPSRVLAGQLSKSPRDYGTDGRLISVLAAEHAGTANAEAETLRVALLRRYFATDAVATQPAPQSILAPAQITTIPPVANDPGRAGAKPLPSARPDLPGFIKIVQTHAGARAQGWPGNRKAFISRVWQAIQAAHPAWALTEIEFKGMLAEAHRTGGIVLASADLKDKNQIKEFELSAIQYKNTTWHFVRVEEE
jgi:hypothetical protein